MRRQLSNSDSEVGQTGAEGGAGSRPLDRLLLTLAQQLLVVLADAQLLHWRREKTPGGGGGGGGRAVRVRSRQGRQSFIAAAHRAFQYCVAARSNK